MEKVYKKLGPIKFYFYLFLIINAIIMVIGLIGLFLPIFKGEHAFRENFLFYNIHLSVDDGDTLMDFYNSVQYGRHPYTDGVIYPPLCNAIYAILGKLITIFKPNLRPTPELRDSAWAVFIFFFSFSIVFAIYICLKEDKESFECGESISMLYSFSNASFSVLHGARKYCFSECGINHAIC